MIKGNLGSVEMGHKSILTGDNHIVVSYPVKADEVLRSGLAVCLENGKVVASGTDPVGVVLDCLGEGNDEVVSLVVFGAVKIDQVYSTAAGAACDNALAEKLRKNGVYAIN